MLLLLAYRCVWTPKTWYGRLAYVYVPCILLNLV